MDLTLSDDARVLCIYTGGTIGMLRTTKGGGFTPFPQFLSSNLRSQSRFHDELQDSVFANSGDVEEYRNWEVRESSRSASPSPTPVLPATGGAKGGKGRDHAKLVVQTSVGPKEIPSLVTPRTAQGKRIRYVVWEYEDLIDSAEIEPADWIRLASDIERNYHLYDSFVILHGTDTMSYSASALSFLLEDLGKTVILTGAQIPLSELLNDSLDNLLGALILAGHYRIPEVCLFFNNKLLRGNRSMKMSSDEFDAFQTPGLEPLARVGIEIDVAWNEVLRPGIRAFKAHKSLSSKVATLRIFPGITGSSVRAFLTAGDVKGVVLESYGAGNAPRREELLSAFREATSRGVVIVNVSQCATGAVAPDIYETGRALAAVGITGGADMTVECALAKLAYLLSKPDLTPAQIRKLIAQPLRGELTLPSPIPTYSAPMEADDRLRILFSRMIECAPLPSIRGPPTSPSSGPSLVVSAPPPPSADLSLSTSPEISLPPEFSSPWPATRKDAEVAEQAVLPYLLGQASARSDGLLVNLLDSLRGSSSATPAAAAIALLNDPATPALHTPLHLAVLSSQPANVTLLLASGASVHSRDVLSHSALFYAARQGSLDIVRELVEAGAHLGEVEIGRGDVGLEIGRAERVGDESALEVWRLAAGGNWDRARECFRALLG